MAERKIGIKISGTPLTNDGFPVDNARYSSRMSCNFIYATSLSDYEYPSNKKDYDWWLGENFSLSAHPIILNYTASQSSIYDVTNEYLGLYNTVASVSSGTQGTFYRRQYDKYEKRSGDNKTSSVKIDKYEYIGAWEPVIIETQSGLFRDFNIKTGHSYQYVMYPSYATQKQVFAKDRTKQDIYAIVTAETTSGDAIHVDWTEGSITELIEEENIFDAPILKKTYKADLNNIGFFKYDLEAGTQKQSLIKNQVNTLGQFPRIAHGSQNNISGSVSCMLGSEIVPYSADGYVERMWQSIAHPLSTNEKVLMLKKWRQFAFSKNPKLLQDTKGQSGIVSIIDSSNTPYVSYHNQPDKINFSGVEIESTDKVIIYGDGDVVERCGGASSLGKSTTRN